MTPKFKYLVQLFRKLPGVGPRQAARFILALLQKDESELQELGTAITALKQSVTFCTECFNISDGPLCIVCENPRRETSKILVVEKVTDLDSVEKTGLYRGLYHVLGGAINPVDGVNLEHLRIQELNARVEKFSQEHGTVEMILATNANTAGETTALYLKEVFGNKPHITITRLARGLSSGTNLEYADEMTLRHALEERR